ncbi:MAG: murein transglycosylase A [Sulfuricella sp.]|nr:murein transglycosylase A [Sulfuricella sp.]
MKKTLVTLSALALSACATPRLPGKAPQPSTAACAAAPACPVCPACPGVVPPTVTPPAAPVLQPATWESISGWRDDELSQAWEAFRQSCAALQKNPAWQEPCKAAASLAKPGDETLRGFFEQYFTPYQVTNPDGGSDGLITGYYEPLLAGSRTPSKRYPHPLYATPDDLISVDLAGVYPELKNLRLRGRLQGNKLVPYYSRAEIDAGTASLKGRELVWVDDAVELFFLQIQGSGRVKLDNGDTLRVGYADQNGYPYKSIGKALVERGELTLDKASMQGIKEWGKQNPDKLADLLNFNASYVFFREMPNTGNGPLGALGVPLSAARSIAIDPRSIPLGAPVFLATTWPGSGKLLQRLMLAQDTGGAIRGAVRADFFWGFGKDAGKHAGSMKQSGKMWVLLPKGMPLPDKAG